jgi:hypothetical protein
VLSNSRGFASIVGDIDTERIALIEAALACVTDGAIADRARLESLLAAELVFDRGRREERLALVDHAVDLLDEIDDPLAEAQVLGITRFPEMVPERWTAGLDRAERSVAAADRCGDPNLRVRNRVGYQWALTSAGDLNRARSVAEEYVEIAADAAGPIMQWTAQAMACQFHLVAGDLAAAAADNDAALEFGLELGALDCESWWAGIAALIIWFRDADYVDADLAGQLADQFPGAPSWRTAQAFALVRQGRVEECCRLIDHHGLGDPMSFPMDMFWFSCISNIARALVILDDADLAGPILAAAEPYADCIGHYGIGLQGPLREALSDLRTASGDLDGGIADARSAVDWATDRQLGLWRTTYQIKLAELLVRRHDTADVVEARTIVAETLPESERLGMVGWLARGTKLLDET